MFIINGLFISYGVFLVLSLVINLSYSLEMAQKHDLIGQIVKVFNLLVPSEGVGELYLAYLIEPLYIFVCKYDAFVMENELAEFHNLCFRNYTNGVSSSTLTLTLPLTLSEGSGSGSGSVGELAPTQEEGVSLLGVNLLRFTRTHGYTASSHARDLSVNMQAPPS